jgi:hypothetical protein
MCNRIAQRSYLFKDISLFDFNREEQAILQYRWNFPCLHASLPV